jgi:hypothetical protein
MFAALVLVVVSSGCTTCQQARRTLLYEPLDFGWKLDRARSLRTYRSWAADAWRIERTACPEAAASDHYAEGFRDGFVDYLYAGGDGAPPPIPPRKFWNMAWRGPTGQAAAQQWFAGFRRGAQVAQDGGYRQQATVESSYRTAVRGGWEAPPLDGPGARVEELGPPREPLPTPSPSLPDEPSGGATPPQSPPAEPAMPAGGDGAVSQFRRALDAAAPAKGAGTATQPLAFPPTEADIPLDPAYNESR